MQTTCYEQDQQQPQPLHHQQCNGVLQVLQESIIDGDVSSKILCNALRC